MANGNLERPWLLLTSVVGSGDDIDISGSSLVNLNTVRRVEIITLTEIRLEFSEAHVVVLQGQGATEFLDFLMHRSMLINGEPFPVADQDESHG